MSKIESGKLTLNMDTISLRDIMDGIVNIIQPQVHARKQVFDIFIQNIRHEQVYCDGVRLNQVLLNLLSNALKFTPEGGQIHVTVSQESSPKGEQYVRTHFWVEDTGIGMSEEFQKKIFESFVREDSKRVHKTEGSGLGMAITKYIVDAMQGTIEVESEKDKGSRFHIILDLEWAKEQEQDMRLPAWDALVVDDDELLCRSAADTLEEIGLHAEWTLDGATAITMAQQRHAEGRDYHVVLLDRKMPGMDGLEFSAKAREMYPDVTIIILTGYDSFEYAKKAISIGVEEYLLKPIDYDEMKKTIGRVAEEIRNKKSRQQHFYDLQRHFNSSLPQLRARFTSNILQGRIQGKEEMKAQLESLDLCIEKYIVCVGWKLTGQGRINAGDKWIEEFAYINIFEEIFDSYGIRVLSDYNTATISCFFSEWRRRRSAAWKWR